MDWWVKFLRRLGRLARGPAPVLREQTVASLQELSQRTRLAPDELAKDLLQRALLEQDVNETSLRSWQTLTRREQQVAALICLGCDTRAITWVLQISPNTLKCHSRSVLAKFGVKSRSELRRLLSGWDFSAWRGLLE